MSHTYAFVFDGKTVTTGLSVDDVDRHSQRVLQLPTATDREFLTTRRVITTREHTYVWERES